MDKPGNALPHIPKLRVASSSLVARSNKISDLPSKRTLLFVKLPRSFTGAASEVYI